MTISVARSARRRLDRAFTLIELLVVMAITVILLGLIFGPMVQGFNLTNRARVQVLAQDTARSGMEIIQRDLANGVFVFDEIPDLTLNQYDPATEAPLPNSVRFWVRNSTGATKSMLLPYGLVDLVPPARANDQNANLAANQIDPTTGLAITRGGIALPLAPGRVIVRYWLGLRDNRVAAGTNAAVMPYGDFYDNVRDPYVTGIVQHNPMVLYRAVVSPFLPNGQVDTRLFHVDAQGRPILYDPNFFYDAAAASAAMPGWRDDNGDGVVQISENWKAVARAMVPTDRADEVVLQRDKNSNVVYDPTTELPRPTPQVRFQPTYVGNDAGAPSAFSDTGNEMPDVSPSSYVETNGAWTLPYRLYVFRSPLNAQVLSFFIAVGDGHIYQQSYDTSTGTYGSAANNGLGTDTGFLLDANGHLPRNAQPGIMFTVDVRRGVTSFAFPDWTVLYDQNGKPIESTFDPNAVNLQYSTSGYRMCSLANLDPAVNPGLASGAQSPLHRAVAGGPTYIPNARIVPGSEVVVGPDMRPGPHYGLSITYTRVPRNSDPLKVGPNEYMINYMDLAPSPTNPLLQAGTIIFDSQPDTDPIPVAGAPDGKPRVNWLPIFSYDSTTGTLTAPASRIMVTYEFQNNLRSDVVKADYLTRQLITVALGVRLFDLNSGQPQQVTLTQKIKVRNLQR